MKLHIFINTKYITKSKKIFFINFLNNNNLIYFNFEFPLNI